MQITHVIDTHVHADHRSGGRDLARLHLRLLTLRSSAVGVYRLWRDSGYVAGALVAGVAATPSDSEVRCGS